MPDEPVAVAHAALARALTRTNARLFTGRAGTGYTTATALQLRADHAAARDAVHQECDLLRDFGPERIEQYQLFSTSTLAGSRAEYLLRPDRGRRFSDVSAQQIISHCVKEPVLQLVLGDGLSATALATQGPVLMDLLWRRARALNWSLGRPFLIQHCRVGILNEIGRLLNPEVVVLLIGERPGLAQADSLSAYLAYRPQPGQTDAHRNLISNIHSQGVPLEQAAERIMQLVMQMRELGYSGVRVKEGLALPR
ncbi:MAG TPA: ethanolamine ammonia-lyase subunit EutC [Gemmatales bacterium]|nr:ethanolamine ammonia-lyase subunit EutC [Gemmatales bacterium]